MTTPLTLIESAELRKKRKNFWLAELIEASEAYNAAVDALILAEEELDAYKYLTKSPQLNRINMRYDEAVELEEMAKEYLNEVESCKATYDAYCDFIASTEFIGYSNSRTTDIIMEAPICNRQVYWVKQTSICYATAM